MGKQKPVLEERRKLLLGDGSQEGPPTGTPALTGFWLQALQNHPALDGDIEEYDCPVLEFLQNIQSSNLDPDDSMKGFRLTFHFAQNPYFENAAVSKEFHTEEGCPYREEIKVNEVVSTSIKWKPGKDVTVAKAKKAVKGKKTKASKAQEEPRPSFFRGFFRSMKQGDPLPDDIDPHEIDMHYGGGSDMNEENLVEVILDNDYEVGQALKDQVVPFAVRFYTGEATPDRDDDIEFGGEDSEEEDDDDDESDEDDEEDRRPPKGKNAKSGKKGAPTSADASKEECKQQ